MSTYIRETPSVTPRNPSYSQTRFLGLLVQRATRVTVRDTGQIAMFIVQPILFYAMFWVVIGGSFELSFGGSYRDYIAPGIAAATVIFGAQGGVGAGVALDRFDGFLGRIKPHGVSLLSAVFARVLVDVFRNAVGCVLIFSLALGLGLRPNSWAGLALGVLPLLGLGIALALPVAWLSLVASSPTAAMSLQLVILMPIGFVSSAYVPVEGLPPAFQPVATWNPVTVTADLVRSLLAGGEVDLAPWLISCGATAGIGLIAVLLRLKTIQL